MKKTLTVNISGIVFHIDEDAYHVLNNYLQSIRKHFRRTEGGDEIVSDIEARIAEMLKDRIGDERQVITIDDIEAVIDTIGQPSEFGDEFSEEEQQSGKTRSGSYKRLYRDPEHAVLGGVCGGLGAYFHTDPVWFRIAFVLLSLPGIGTPLLVYVILWIVVPEAKTAAERLEMRGEKVNISNIEKSIREEIDNLKDKFNDFTKGARRRYKKKSEATKSEIENLGSAIGRVAELFVKIVLVFTGLLLFLVGLSFIIALLAVLFGFGNDIFIVDSELVYISFPALVDFFIGTMGSDILFRITFLMLVGLPVFMILYAGIKLLFGLPRTKVIGVTALNLWIVALIVSAFYGFKIARSFSHTGVHKEIANMEVPENSLVRLEMNKNEKFNNFYRYDEYFEIEEGNMIITNDQYDFYYGIPELEIIKGTEDEIEVDIYYRSRGKSNLDAEYRAEQTLYSYSIDGSALTFDQFFKLSENEVWRKQEIDIVVKLPVGCKVYISENMRFILNSRYHSPYRLSGETWVMTEKGLEEAGLNLEERDDNPIPHDESLDHIEKELSEKHERSTFFGIIYNKLTGVLGYSG